MIAPEFSLFVSSVEGHMVYRFGTRQLIGAKWVYDPPLAPNEDPAGRDKTLKWQPDRIVPITTREFGAHNASYRGAIANGGLKEHKREAWEAQCAADAKAEQAARETADKAAKNAAKKAASDTP